MENDHPLTALNNKKVGPNQVRIELKPLRSRQGWTHFLFYLEDQTGTISFQERPQREWVDPPMLQGIHSRGGRGVAGWIEVGEYRPITNFRILGNSSENLTLLESKIDQQIFNLLSEVIPLGGHLMFVYEVSFESPLHQETEQGLLRGIPPVSMPQGGLLFYSGFRWVKDWYLAEGGHEGLRKLWGEKPFNEEELKRFDLLTFFQILAFFSRKPNPAFLELEVKARKRTRGILSELRIEPTLSILREKLMAIYPDDLDKASTEEATRRCCQLMEDYKTVRFEDILIREELDKISRACLGV